MAKSLLDLKREYYSTMTGLPVSSSITDLEYAFFLAPPAGGGGGAVTSVNGSTGAVVLTKNDVGLANVANTTDAAKPVSTAQQSALDLKSNIASPVFTGTVTLPGAPSANLHAATKLYVDGAVSTEATARSAADTTLTNAQAITAVLVVESGGNYTVPANAVSSQGRILVGTDNPGSLFRAGQDIWIQVPAVP